MRERRWSGSRSRVRALNRNHAETAVDSSNSESDSPWELQNDYDGRRTTRASEITSSRHVSSPEPTGNELAILVMGVTGSGKSTFISRLTNDNVEIGHSLESCTAEVEGYTITRRNGQKIYLIDTPGFDDTQTSDVDLLQKIASALDAMYTNDDIRFAGLIYMHRITDQRVAGSSLKSLRIFEKICGEENFPYVVLVTSMWNLLEADLEIGEKREETLETKDEFFGKMVKGGAEIMRDGGDHKSAYAILDRITRQRSRVVTSLQRELADVHKTLGESTVGIFLRGEMERTRKRYEVERQELLEALEEARRDQEDDSASISEQTRELEELEERMSRAAIDESNLSITKEGLAQIRADWCSRMLEEAEQKRREAQRFACEVEELQGRLRKRERQHVAELDKLRREAKDNEHALKEISHRFNSEKEALEHQLNEQKAQSEAKDREAKKHKQTRGFLERISRALDIPNVSLQRAQSFPFGMLFPRRDSKPNATVKEPRDSKASKAPKEAQHVQPKRSKEKKPRSHKQHKDRALTAPVEQLATPDYDTTSSGDGYPLEHTFEEPDNRPLSTPAQSMYRPLPQPQGETSHGYTVQLATPSLGPLRRIPDKVPWTYDTSYSRNDGR